MRWIGRALLALIGVVAILAGVMAARTLMLPPAAAVTAATEPAGAPKIDADRAAARLGEAIRIPTISREAGVYDAAALDALQSFLRTTYPLTFQRFTVETVAEKSLLLTLPGSDAALQPIVLMAHQDVVPVEAGTEKDWTAPPFGGEIKDGYVLGRGASDDKGSLIAILEATEALLAQGFAPKRTLMLAFGHDEEVLGSGATQIAALLKSRNVKPWFVLDEGMAIIEKFPLTGQPATLIGIAEKGYMTVVVRARDVGGHSSMPGPLTAAEKLAKALIAIDAKGFPGGLESGPGRLMLEALAPNLPFAQRLAIANLWITRPLLEGEVAKTRAGAALMGTTVAPTILGGGTKDNVLPQETYAVVNLRLHPRDSRASALAHLRAAVAGIDGVTVEEKPGASEPSPVSSTTGDAYTLLATTARAVAPPGAPVAPSLVLGGTDSRHFSGVAENVYRFTPAVFNEADLAGIHGTNERLSVANLDRMCKFYVALILTGAS